MQKLVSVIIPVYKVENYLEECVDSIINQTYSNLEIFLIDDGSPDNCPEMCDDYEMMDKRIKAFHQQNRGSASAKNIGLELANGEYIIFVDSDDILPLDSIERRVRLLEENGVDIVQGQLVDFTSNNIENIFRDDSIVIFNQTEFLKYYLKDWKNAIFCNKIFKKSIIDNIRFLEGRCIDDEFFTYKVIFNAEKILLTNTNVYYYRMRKGSAIHNKRNYQQIIKDQIDFMAIRYWDLQVKENQELNEIFLENIIDNYIQFFRKPNISLDNVKYLKKKVKELGIRILSIRIYLLFWILYYLLLPARIIVNKADIGDSLLGDKEQETYFD